MDLGLRPDDRVLVLGSSGWFGREFQALAAAVDGRFTVLDVPGPSSGVATTNSELREFAPTVVLNFAFLTRERVDIEGVEQFTRINEELCDRFLSLAGLRGVRAAVTVSSGAAVTEPDHPYGRLKEIEERSSLELITSDRTVVVIRAYAVSGGYVRRPRAYAFSDFIVQADAGRIEIQADHPVVRRFCAVPDALTVALRSAASGRSGIFETGGDLVEMGELAQRVAARVNPSTVVARPPLVSQTPSSYHSDDVEWREWCEGAGVSPLSLDEQIEAAAAVLLRP